MPCRGARGVTVPQGEADPLTGVRPGGRSPHHEVRRRFRTVRAGLPVPGQSNGQARSQQSVRSDPRHVPPQQIGCQMAQIVADAAGEFPAVDAAHGTEIEIDIDPGGGTGPAQSPPRRRVEAVSIMEGGTANSRTRSQRERREAPFAVEVSISTHLARTGPPICEQSE